MQICDHPIDTDATPFGSINFLVNVAGVLWFDYDTILAFQLFAASVASDSNCARAIGRVCSTINLRSPKEWVYGQVQAERCGAGC